MRACWRDDAHEAVPSRGRAVAQRGRRAAPGSTNEHAGQGAGGRRHAAQRQAARRPARREGLCGRDGGERRGGARQGRVGVAGPHAARRHDARDSPDTTCAGDCAPIRRPPCCPSCSSRRSTRRASGSRASRPGADDFLGKPINQAELFARVRSLLRVKSLQDEVKRQAEALKEWNLKLEERVAEQVAQIAEHGPAQALLRAGRRRRDPVGGREIDPRAASSRDLLRVRRPARLHRVHRRGRAGGGRGGAAALSRDDGGADRRIRRDARPLRRRRHPRSSSTIRCRCRTGPKRATRMALRMQEQFDPLRARWSKLGYELDLGIGIAQGYATVGAFGYEGRVDYTAIGSVVNLAARLSDEAGPGEVLIDRRTRAALDDTASVRQPRRARAQGVHPAGDRVSTAVARLSGADRACAGPCALTGRLGHPDSTLRRRPARTGDSTARPSTGILSSNDHAGTDEGCRITSVVPRPPVVPPAARKRMTPSEGIAIAPIRSGRRGAAPNDGPLCCVNRRGGWQT